MQFAQEILPFEDVPLELSVELGQRILTVREILQMDVGSLLALPRSAGENIDILLGGQLFASGEIVVIEDSFGVRITNFPTE